MKRLLLIITAVTVAFAAMAQNNAYELDDECYERSALLVRMALKRPMRRS